MNETEKPIEDMSSGAAEEEAQDERALPAAEEVVRAAAIETPALTEKEIKAIVKRARDEVEKEYRDKLKAKLLDEEKKKQREALSMADNSHLNGPLSDLVRITIEIPEFSNAPWIQVNQPHGLCYLHGQTYTLPRHVANSLRETMQRMRAHQNEIDGKRRNRQLPDGRFVDATTGRVSAGGTTISGVAA